MNVPQIEIPKARELHEAGSATFVDIRDPASFESAHIPGAEHLSDGSLARFLDEADKSRPVVVYCYHGNSSIGGAGHLLEQGFREVYSMKGGFEGWRSAGAPHQASEGDATQSGSNSADAPQGMVVTDLAKTKLAEFLAGEPQGTCVRITQEPMGLGLSLDEPTVADARFSVNGIEFAVEKRVVGLLEGLSIDFVEEGNNVGFAMRGGKAPAPPSSDDLLGDIKQRIADNKVMLFMKGNAMQPMCGFSARTVAALQSTGKPFGDKNVLEIPEYRHVLSSHSSWPTIPQVFIDGKFVGGCDIVLELQASGELQKMVDAAYAE